MLLSPRKNGLTSLFKEVRVFKEGGFAEVGVCRPDFMTVCVEGCK